ncbi:MAG: hypothetical protein IKN94_11920, partial [Salinivirgaceae bacterium]|nr:hypothetical protein [Salinivirgaceae bacterium]
MRNLRQFFLTTLAVLCSTLTTWAAYSGSSKAPAQITADNYADYGFTADNYSGFVGYYGIGTAEELYGFAAWVNSGSTSINAVLTADIVINENVLNADGTLNGTPTYRWTPIGSYPYKAYVGTLDGNGHTISGLYVNASSKYVGLIGYSNNGTIKNLGVIDSYIEGSSYVGGICGSGGIQTNCYNTGTVSSSGSRVGGICGGGGTQTNCYNTGTVSGSAYVGGICGSSRTAITNCYNTGTVSGSSSDVGGICGSASGSTIINSYNIGEVSSSRGGICPNGTITNCYYLEGCCSGNGGGFSTTAEEFASGKITYQLNGNTSEGNLTWYQTLGNGNDAYPVFDNTHAVVYATQPCTIEFSNTEGAVNPHPSVDEITGYCPVCGQFTVHGALVTENNYSSLNLSADFVGYYAISNTAELYWFANEVNNGNATINAVLTANIVVNENVLNEDGTLNGTPTYSWTPIGTSSFKYAGTFDGNGHTISGLYFSNTTNNAYPNGGSHIGLIGYANDGATIKNVGVVDSYFKGDSYVGGICGYCSNTNTTISNCYNTGTVSGSAYVGGICSVNGTITNCYNMGTVSSSGSRVGGICGNNGSQTNCYNTGMVSGSSNSVGGICGDGGTQNNCYYLADCGSKNTLGVSATADEFASGKITYLLNGGTSEGNLAWYQTIGTDALPVWDNTHGVVYKTLPCPSFSNDANNTHKDHLSMDPTGRCTACGQLIAHGTLVTESNYNNLNLTADFVGYYAISNSVELYWFANEVNSGRTSINAVLTADIVVNENVLNADGTLNGTPTYSWTPIGTGTWGGIFKGTFDGNGHTISGLYFNNTTNSNYPDGGNNVGLIGKANDGATIKNVGVVDSYFKGYSYVGGICGVGGTQTNCYNTGTVSGSSSYVGGICGCSSSSTTTITNCYNTGTVSGSGHVGGICGDHGTQTNCYNTGTVSGSGYVGGICGYYGTQTNCHNTGTITSSSSSWYIGGICGYDGVQTNCYNTGSVTGGGYVGGICSVDGTITNCYNTGTITGTGTRSQDAYYGGICGSSGTQTNCYNTGAVSGRSSYGGICGNYGTQTNCYYLEGCCSRSGGGVSVTAEEFASG